MDKLYDSVAEKGNVCVGLDTSPNYLPPAALASSASGAEAVLAYNSAIIAAAAPYAACFKVQIAYYEALGIAGLKVYAETLRLIRTACALAIADIKRGDIADTAAQYAAAHFAGEFEADFVTLSPYMGMDSLDPWLAFADTAGKGAFVLVRTSNKGMRDFEYLEVCGGKAPPASKARRPKGPDAFSASPLPRGSAPKTPPHRLYHEAGDKLAELAAGRKGASGYGAFGAVVGCTEHEEAAEIRERYDSLFFLIPGYGAQGGAAEDAALLLRNGNGGVVNASRSLLRAWTKEAEDAERLTGKDALHFAAEAAARAAKTMRDEIRAASS